MEASRLRQSFSRSGSISLSPQGAEHNDARRLLNLAATFLCLLFLAACTSKSNSGQSNAPDPAPLAASTALLQPSVQVTVQPALTPNFQLSIHDYVVDCISIPDVQFTAQIGDN